MLQKLPDQARDALKMIYIDQKSRRDAAALLHMTMKELYKTLASARKKLLYAEENMKETADAE